MKKFFVILFVLVIVPFMLTIGCSVNQNVKQPKVVPEVLPQVGQLDMEYLKYKCPVIRRQYLLNGRVILFTLQYLKDPTIGIVQVFYGVKDRLYGTYRYLKGNELFFFVIESPNIYKRFPIPDKNYDAVRDELLRYKNGFNA